MLEDSFAALLEAHEKLDAERFGNVTTTLTAIHEDVKELLERRAYIKGVWKVLTILAGAVSVLVSVAAAWFR